MKIDRPIADGAAARQRHARFTGAGEQRAKHQDGGAHLAHDVIGRFGRGHAAGAQRHDTAEILRPRAFDHGRDAKLVEQMAETVHIGEPRQVAQRHRLIRQQRAGEQRERGIFRAGNGKAAVQRVAAANINAVHRTGLIAANARRARRVRWAPTCRRRAGNNIAGPLQELIEFSAEAENAAKRRKGRFAIVTTIFCKKVSWWQQAVSRSN